MICKVKPYNGDQPYIFFSYCHADEKIVYPIIEELTYNGFRIWFDEGINPGADWPEVVGQKLNNATMVIAAVSPKSTRSHNCKNEMTVAVDDDKPLISLMLEDFTLPFGIRLQLANTQYIKMFEYSHDELFEKIYSSDEIKNCLGDIPSEVIMEKDRKEIEEQEKIKVEAERLAEEERQRHNAEEAEKKAVEEERRAAEEKRQEELKRKIEEDEKRKIEEEKEKLRIESEKEEKRKQEERQRIKIKEVRLKSNQGAKLQPKQEIHSIKEENKIENSDGHNVFDLFEQYEEDDDSTIMSDDEETIMSEEESDETIMEDDPTVQNTPIIIRLNTSEIFQGLYPLTSIGRSKNECDIYFEESRTMSSHHADIVIHDGKCFIIDHDSKNYTYYNGEKMEKGGRLEIINYAQISLSNAEPLLIAFNQYADWIVKNRYIISLTSLETKERLFIFEAECQLGRLNAWSSGAMSSRTVSRQQAKLVISDFDVKLFNISPNGSFVNGVKIEPDGFTSLNDGDNIRFGKEHFIFNYKKLKEGQLV